MSPMKRLLNLLSIIIFLQNINCIANDTITKLDYRIIKYKDSIDLKIFLDVAIDIYPPDFNQISPIHRDSITKLLNDSINKITAKIAAKTIDNLINQINSNNKVRIRYHFPEFFNRILDLVENPLNKNKARNIFKENTIKNVVQMKITTTYSYLNNFIPGKTRTTDESTNFKFEFIIPLKVVSETYLLINPIKIDIYNKIKTSNSLKIKIEK